jgi:hypothetical protein
MKKGKQQINRKSKREEKKKKRKKKKKNIRNKKNHIRIEKTYNGKLENEIENLKKLKYIFPFSSYFGPH